jgi:hypothetical protein
LEDRLGLKGMVLRTGASNSGWAVRTPRETSEDFVPCSTPSRISPWAGLPLTWRKQSPERENSAPTSAERVCTAERAFAIGVVGEDVDPDELTRPVHAVAEGNALLSARTTAPSWWSFAREAELVRPRSSSIRRNGSLAMENLVVA